jgi:hypothetical protein
LGGVIGRLIAVCSQAPRRFEDGRYPFWSPDSKTVAFFAEGKLKRIDTAGGLPVSYLSAEVGGRRFTRQMFLIRIETPVCVACMDAPAAQSKPNWDVTRLFNDMQLGFRTTEPFRPDAEN